MKAYLEGTWPPQQPNNLRAYVRLTRHAARAHAQVRQVLRRARPDAMVSIAFALWPLQPLRRWNPIDQAMAFFGDWLGQDRILRRTLPTLDWIGVNYYSRTFVGWPWPTNATERASGQRTDFGWEIYPEGLYSRAAPRRTRRQTRRHHRKRHRRRRRRPAARLSRRSSPADAPRHPGRRRPARLHALVLLDNFEWAEGYEQHFGLATRDRRPRPSARLYGTIARANGVPDDVLGTFSVT